MGRLLDRLGAAFPFPGQAPVSLLGREGVFDLFGDAFLLMGPEILISGGTMDHVLNVFSDVRIHESKAQEALNAILGWRKWEGEFQTRISDPLAAGVDPVEVLARALYLDHFVVERRNGYIHLLGYGKASGSCYYGATDFEHVFLGALGNLFEAGGRANGVVVDGPDDENHGWSYEFLGGTYQDGDHRGDWPDNPLKAYAADIRWSGGKA